MVFEALNTVIGLGVVAIAKVSDNEFKLTDIWTEFVGDGAQGILAQIISGIKRQREIRKIGTNFKNISKEDLEIYKEIFKEIKNNEEESSNNQKHNFFGKFREQLKNKFQSLIDKFKNNKSLIGTDIIKISNEILWKIDYEDYLEENAPKSFGKLEKEEKQSFLERLKIVIDIYRQDVFAKTDESVQVVANIVVNSLKVFIDDRMETQINQIINRIDDMIKPFLSRLAISDGGVNLQKIEMATYTPKYILNKCPECGYFGDRLYVNEHNAMTYCAACGQSYSIVKYDDSELWKKVELEFNNLTVRLNNTDKSINDLSDGVKQAVEFLRDMDIETKKLIKNGLEQSVTNSYLEKCLSEKESTIVANNAKETKNIVETAFNKYCEQLNKQKNNFDEIKDLIRCVNDSNKKLNTELLTKINSCEERLIAIDSYAREQFLSQGGKLNDIKQAVELIVNRYLENFDFKLEMINGELENLVQEIGKKSFKGGNLKVDTCNAVINSYCEKLDNIEKYLIQGNVKMDTIISNQTDNYEKIEAKLEKIKNDSEKSDANLAAKLDALLNNLNRADAEGHPQLSKENIAELNQALEAENTNNLSSKKDNVKWDEVGDALKKFSNAKQELVKVRLQTYCDAMRNEYNEICLKRQSKFSNEVKKYRQKLLDDCGDVMPGINEIELEELEKQVAYILQPNDHSKNKQNANKKLDDFKNALPCGVVDESLEKYCNAMRNEYNEICLKRQSKFGNEVKKYRQKLLDDCLNKTIGLDDKKLEELEKQVTYTLRPTDHSRNKQIAEKTLKTTLGEIK